MVKSVLITGANSGLGLECARQMASQSGIEKVLLGCRNEKKAEEAKSFLEQNTGKTIFEIVKIDVSNVDSVKNAVNSIDQPIDALVMNAGGMGGKEFMAKNSEGVTQIMASNVLGHMFLLDALLKSNKLNKVAIYAGSEASRGVSKMGMKQPKLESSSVDEFKSLLNGSFFTKNEKVDVMEVYGYAKYIAALNMSSFSNENPNLRILTVSPGGTSGTSVMEDLPQPMKFLFKQIGVKIMPYFGLMHSVEKGAKRYVDVLNNEKYKSGIFYGSKKGVLTGELVDQSQFFKDLSQHEIQNNASKAVQSFLV